MVRRRQEKRHRQRNETTRGRDYEHSHASSISRNEAQGERGERKGGPQFDEYCKSKEQARDDETPRTDQLSRSVAVEDDERAQQDEKYAVGLERQARN